MIVSGLDQNRVAVFIAHHHGRGSLAQDVEAHHLKRRERAAHPIRIHQRQAYVRGHRGREQRVHATHLGAHDRRRLATQPRFERAQRFLAFVEADRLFDDDGGRAHRSERNHERIVVEFVHREHARRAVALESLFEQEAADVRIAPASRAEERCPSGEITAVFEIDVHVSCARTWPARRPL